MPTAPRSSSNTDAPTSAEDGSQSAMLSDYPLFRSVDPEETQGRVAAVFCPHELRVIGASQHLHVQHNLVRLQETAINFLAYGAHVEIDPGRLGNFYLAQIPVTGHANILCGHQKFLSDVHTASLLSPETPTRMQWHDDCAQVLLWISKEAIEHRFALLTGRDPGEPLSFEPTLPKQAGPSSSWTQAVLDLARNIDQHGTHWLQFPVAVASMEDYLLRTLLLLQPHTYTEFLARSIEPAKPRHLQRVIDYVQANVDQPLTVADLAQVACVSIRALEEGFRRHLNTTPVGYLRDVRLDSVRQALLAAAGAKQVSVADIAYRFGFTHLGRFAAYYKKRFGVPPSATLHSAGAEPRS
ncbi:AraC family transcriptional regulator [Cupriavidus taiwanensis]|uniref:AraC family transcriptional regulator n=1 Tax=Cupriavidus taiwanensis TaxID=164546 RepID=UPI000E1B0885|nr:AraC family transcriptional regulator [Cupriavidus taiwanensis]SOZ30160.1 AraC family transcriptional regulator [Cupriavidus taiwanensis]SPA34848.1 AraC family transcriptional regulator [Cupriavidus taiwanensis]